MEFQAVRLVGNQAVVLPILTALPSSPYIAKNIDGLGPPGSDLAIIANVIHQGGTYQGRTFYNRELTIRIGLNPDYSQGQTPSTLRTALYHLIAAGPESPIFVQLGNPDPIFPDTFNFVAAQVDGFVKTLDPVVFSKDPEVQIVIGCMSPYLKAPAEVTITNLTENPSINSVVNPGSAPTGFRGEIVINKAMNQINLEFEYGLRKAFLNLKYPFLTGDRVIFDTRPGQRRIFRVRNGVSISILDSMTSLSNWLELYGGQNYYRMYENVGGTYVGTSDYTFDKIQFTPQYWGV